MSTATLLIGSTNRIELSALQDTDTLAYPEDATVVAALLDPAGTPVVGATAIAMPHVLGTTGSATTYRGTIPHSLSLSTGEYTARVTATTTAGEVRTLDIACRVQRG